jgi:hypothetical protein
MELAARIYDCFRVTGRGAFLMFEFASDTTKLRVGDKIQLSPPRGAVVEAVIRGIEHVKPIERTRPYNVAMALELPFQNELFEKNTEIWVASSRD